MYLNMYTSDFKECLKKNISLCRYKNTFLISFFHF